MHANRNLSPQGERSSNHSRKGQECSPSAALSLYPEGPRAFDMNDFRLHVAAIMAGPLRELGGIHLVDRYCKPLIEQPNEGLSPAI